MNINHRHLVLLILALVALSASIFTYSFFYNFVKSEAEESAQLSQQIAAIEEQRRHEQGVASVYQQSVSDLAALKSYVVTGEQVVDLIEEIEEIGTTTSTSLELTGITNSANASQKEGEFSVFTATVHGKGTWTNIMRALILIEHLPYSMSINNIRFAEEGAGPARVWTISFGIKVLTTK